MTEQPEKKTKLTAMQKAIRKMIGALEDRAPAAPPPFEVKGGPLAARAEIHVSSLKKARMEAAQLAGWFSDDMFSTWARLFLLPASNPSEWTQATALYENYVKLASLRGADKAAANIARSVIVTQTQWGKMMGSLYPNKRRTRAGWFYPVKLIKGT